MNDLILTKMREGDWGAVVRLMREEREGVPSTAHAGESVYRSQPMPFRERFETMRVTPQKIADSVIEENALSRDFAHAQHCREGEFGIRDSGAAPRNDAHLAVLEGSPRRARKGLPQ